MSNDKSDTDIAFIRALAEILTENDLGEIEVSRELGEDNDLTVRLARNSSVVPVQQMLAPAAAAPVASAAPAAAVAEQPAATVSASSPGTDSVPSPMVGTVYLAAEPGAAAFVAVGDTVAKGQTILIIEAMKTMNQIASPKSGVVKEIFVSDAEPVEFGSPLMTIV